MKMGAYLSVTRGSDVPPKFVEVEYKGGKEGDAPFALVGKGITFDRYVLEDSGLHALNLYV